MGNLGKIALGMFLTLLLAACAGSTTAPKQDGGSGTDPRPAERITTEALHDCSLDGITVSELAGAVSLEFLQLARPGKFIRLTFPAGTWPKSDGISWTFQPGDAGSVATAVAVSGNTADIGIIAGDGASPRPAAINIPVTNTPPADSEQGSSGLSATAELLSVTELDDDRVKLDWIQALPGDFDFNGRVELADLTVLAGHLGEVVEYEDGVGVDNASYWLDSNQDGVISPEDGSAVSRNLSVEIARYVIGRDSPDIKPDAPGTISVSVEQSTTSGKFPPAYSIEVAGTADTEWNVVAVDSTGRIGAPRKPVRREFDLVAKINLFGIELVEFPVLGDQGSRRGKIGARVIEPIDVVNRGTISRPVISDDLIFKFANLPRDRELLLDVNYVPRQSLSDGQPVQLEVGPIDSLSQVEEAAATAVPFNLSGGPGMGQLSIDIFFLPNPQGGYWIEVNAVSAMPGDCLPSFHHTLLDYSEGILSVDANGDNKFEPGWYFSDGDRDNVSDAWIEQNEQLDDFGYTPDQMFTIQGTVLAVNQQSNTIQLGGISWYDSPVFADPLDLQYNEGMLIFAPGQDGMPLLTPTELEAGVTAAATYYVLRDPSGARADALWLDQLFVIEDVLP